MKKLSTHKLAAAVTTTLLATQSGAAFAAEGLSNVSDKIVASSLSFPDLISTTAYVGGVGMGVTGVFKLKQHVDQPAQNPMKDGLIRLGAGGGLLALPALTTNMIDTVGEGQGTAPGVIAFDGLGSLN